MASIAAAVVVIGVITMPVGSSGAASSSTQVTAYVVSSTTIVNECLDASARLFGSVPLESQALTATTAGDVCRIGFGGSAATQLRIGQADGQGRAMSQGITPPVQLASGAPASAPGRILGVFGYDDQLAWSVGRVKTFNRTTDGGATWRNPLQGNIPGYVNGTDVEMRPGAPDEWWFTGEDRRLLRTTNGRAVDVDDVVFSDRETELSAVGWPGGADINELTFASANRLVIVGEDGNIAIRDFASNTWTRTTPAAADGGNIIAVDALDALNWIAVTVEGRILRTSDGGVSWSYTMAPSPIRSLRDVIWASASRAYVVGDDGYLAIWDGSSWSSRDEQLSSPYDLTGVTALPGSPDSALIAEERGGVFRTSDGGATWQHHATRTGSRTGDLHAATATTVYLTAAERHLTSSADGGLTWNIPTIPIESTQALQDVAASPIDGSRLLAVGQSALRSTDGGSSWTDAPTPGTTGALYGVALATDVVGWAVGDDARIVYTDDLGATWTQQPAPAGVTRRLYDVSAVDRWRVIAVGIDGVILTTTSGGSGWQARPSGTTHTLTAVDTTAGLAVAVGARGTVLRSLDDGASWQTIAGANLPDADANLADVAVTGPSTAFALTTRGEVWRTYDAGATWATTGTTSIAGRSLAAVEQTVVAAGLNGRIARSTDGGSTFTDSAGPSSMHLAGSVALDSHATILVGADSQRLRSDALPAAELQVEDWSLGSNDWDTAGFFGVCLQDAGGSASHVWQSNLGVPCATDVTHAWRAVPATATVAAQLSGGLGHVDLVWGFAPKPDQGPGRYEAAIAFEALAP